MDMAAVKDTERHPPDILNMATFHVNSKTKMVVDKHFMIKDAIENNESVYAANQRSAKERK